MTTELEADGLLAALRRLDVLLARAVAAAGAAYGPEAAADPFRGLHITPDEADRLLARPPGTSPLGGDGATLIAADRLGWLGEAFGLTPFDLDVVLIALAPEVDLRYERLYAYLQDDVSRRRPAVDLALNLLCATPGEKLARRAHFAPDAPLIRHGLIQLIADPHQPRPPLLAHSLRLDDQIAQRLLAQDGLDPRLAAFVQLLAPAFLLEDLPLTGEQRRALRALVLQTDAAGLPLRLGFYGPRGMGQRRAAEALAGELGAALLVANLAGAPLAGSDLAEILRLLFREAWLQDTVLYLEGASTLSDAGQRALRAELAASGGVVILAGAQPWRPDADQPLELIGVPFEAPAFAQRRDCWERGLADSGLDLDGASLDTLAGRFRLGPAQVEQAVAEAWANAQWRAAAQDTSPPEPTIGDLFAAARAQAGHELAALARKVIPVHSWDDLILPEDTLAQLCEICARVAARQRVLGEWGFGTKLAHGQGVTALFAGPSGTGKTTAAAIIAGELGLDLYTIDLAGVVSKYIGETEKNLDRVFAAAEGANAVLFFDEADALFGKRSEVRDSHDRYANIEISYLLQRMEQYAGLAILATNLRRSLDEAFTRRLAFAVNFPFPDEADRRRIWRVVWPRAAPLAADLDLDALATRFKLSGGNIKNIALAAAYLAASDGGAVTMTHLRHATRREYQKLGKALSEVELGGA